MSTRLTVRDISEETGISQSTFRYWRATGEGPRSYSLGRKVFYDREDVDAWIEQQKAATSRGGAA